MTINDTTDNPVPNHNAAAAAIEFALGSDVGTGSDGLEFLRLWNDGEFDKVREYWPSVPDAVFIGADPLWKPKAPK